MAELLPSIGILGGTFNPIHIGHLRSALEVKEALKLDEMRLIPSFKPPHRQEPVASPDHRLTMTEFGTKGSELRVDDREILRKGTSFTVDTLTSLRNEFPNHSISMVLGSDAFFNLQSWHEWSRIPALCNIIVIHRAGCTLPTDLIEKLDFQNIKESDNLSAFSQGRIKTQKITQLDVSGKALRAMMATGSSPRFLMPENVLKYIEENRLYGYSGVVSHLENRRGGE